MHNIKIIDKCNMKMGTVQFKDVFVNPITKDKINITKLENSVKADVSGIIIQCNGTTDFLFKFRKNKS